MAEGLTKHSKKIDGVAGNYGWPVSFDKTDGFVGITQFDEDGHVKDRVLLSRGQLKELRRFTEPRKRKDPPVS